MKLFGAEIILHSVAQRMFCLLSTEAIYVRLSRNKESGIS